MPDLAKAETTTDALGAERRYLTQLRVNIELRLMAKFSEHYNAGIETGKKGRAVKNDRNLEILNGQGKDKEGSSRGDTTTNLHNFSSRIFLVPVVKLENPVLGAPGRKHGKYQARKPRQLF